MDSPITHPDGWHALRQEFCHVLYDGLFIGGQPRAIVEAFSDNGPWYANAITPEDEHLRLGPGDSHSAAAEWCERVTGYRPPLPSASPSPTAARSDPDA